MLNIILGFGGRVGRLHYFLLSLLLGFVMTLLTFAIIFGMMPHYVEVGGKVPDGMPPMILLVTMLVVTPPFLWFSFALQAKRIRDIGWPPLIVVPAWIVANIVDAVAAGGGHGGSAIGLGINAGMVLVLLFWPGRAPDMWTPPSFGSAATASPFVPGAVADVPQVTPPLARRGFGRKGL